MSPNLKCHPKWNNTKTAMSPKLKCHRNWNRTHFFQPQGEGLKNWENSGKDLSHIFFLLFMTFCSQLETNNTLQWSSDSLPPWWRIFCALKNVRTTFPLIVVPKSLGENYMDPGSESATYEEKNLNLFS